MDNNVFDVGIGILIDNKGLKKDLATAEKSIKNFAGNASKVI